MTDPNGSTFARRIRTARPRNKTYDVWDDVITGLALRVGATGHRSFFLRRSVRGRKTVRIYLKARILPAFGRMPLDRISPEDVAAWFDAASRDRPSAANRALEILRAMMFRAEEWGLRERDSNPCLGIRKNPRNHVARFLDTEELGRLGRALDEREAEWPEAVAAIRLLALTGCRRGEVLDLRWRDIGEDAIKLADSKIGPRAVPLGGAARALIETLPGDRDPDGFLFPRYTEGRGQDALRFRWRAVCTDAGLGRLLGHRRHSTTAGYAHLADDHLVEAAERVGSIIAKAMFRDCQKTIGSTIKGCYIKSVIVP